MGVGSTGEIGEVAAVKAIAAYGGGRVCGSVSVPTYRAPE